MGAEVTKRVQGGPLAKKLEVILGDVIKLPQIPPCDALISNTPYQISSPLIFKMLSMPNPPRVAVLMVRAGQLDPKGHPIRTFFFFSLTTYQFQREFAKRLVAKPGDALYSRLSVNVNFWATCKHIMVSDNMGSGVKEAELTNRTESWKGKLQATTESRKRW